MPELRDTAWRGTTIRNFLLMRSGMKWDEATLNLPQNDQVVQWVDLALDYYSAGRLGKSRNESLRTMRRVGPQGGQFTYNSANPQVLGWMLESIYSKPLNEILSTELWKPLGMAAPAYLMTDRHGDVLGSMSLMARPADWLELGEMMRRGGLTSDGTRIVSADWVRQATTGLLPTGDGYRYGFQWWNGATPRGFQANGFLGQFTTVVPESCVTALRLAHTIEHRPGRLVQRPGRRAVACRGPGRRR